MYRSVTFCLASLLLVGAGSVWAQISEGLYGISVNPGHPELEDKLYYLNPDTGQVTEIGSLGLSIETIGVDFSCDGTLWGFSLTQSMPNQQHTLYSVDLQTGHATIRQIFDTSAFPNRGVGFEFGTDEETFYWRNNMDLNVLNLATGQITPVTTLSGDAVSLTVSPSCDGTFLSVEHDGQLVSVDELGNRVVLGQTGLIAVTSLASAPDGRIFGHRMGTLYEFFMDGTATRLFDIGAKVAGLAWGPTQVSCAEFCPFNCPPTLDFERDDEGLDLVSGQIIDDEFAGLGITVTTHDPVNHPAMIFDSSVPTCQDEDLGTPNETFGSGFPGVGAGGEVGTPGRNALPRGNVLIIAETVTGGCVPDDDGNGGTLTFTFDPPAPLVTEVHILDVEEGEGGQSLSFGGVTPPPWLTEVSEDDRQLDIGLCECEARVEAWDNIAGSGTPLVSRSLFGYGNNSFQVVPVDARDVQRLDVTLCGSGAVSAVIFCRDCGANYGRGFTETSALQAPMTEPCLNCFD